MAPVLTTGARVAGFRIRRLIGAGAMGTVYLADPVDGGAPVALKVLTPGLTEDERFRQRFERESALAAAVDHPNVVPPIASGEAGGHLYLAMRFVEGSDLREILRRERRLEPERALFLLGQVADGLDAAHAVGLVHRDVKPANILVADQAGGEVAYICDFGLARHVSSVGSLTGDRGFVGTVDYIPPEQVEGGTVDGRADVYSLGCVLYECLTGVRPFDRESELSIVFAHLNEPPPRVSEEAPALPSGLDAVVARALAKTADDRYRTCGELIEAAGDALHRSDTRPSWRRRRIAVLSSFTALVIAGAAAGAVVLSQPGAAHRAAPAITQRSIAGVELGHDPAYYRRRLGAWRAQELTVPGFPSLAFQQAQVAVYFPAKGKPAHIITTWNRELRTAEGIGPCSTIADLKKAYGNRAKPSWAGTSKDGVSSYVVGRNLLFDTQDLKTVTAVALYQGDPKHTKQDSPQAYANYVAAVETACK